MNSAIGDNRSIVEQRLFDVAINRANCRNSERASCKAYRYPASNFAGSYMSNLTNSGTIARNMVLKTPECEGDEERSGLTRRAVQDCRYVVICNIAAAHDGIGVT